MALDRLDASRRYLLVAGLALIPLMLGLGSWAFIRARPAPSDLSALWFGVRAFTGGFMLVAFVVSALTTVLLAAGREWRINRVPLATVTGVTLATSLALGLLIEKLRSP